jgi:hypothetical protein
VLFVGSHFDRLISVSDPSGYSLSLKVAYNNDGSVKYRSDFRGRRAGVAAVRRQRGPGQHTDSVVKINTYVIDDACYRPEFRAVREEFFGTKGPASTMVEVSALAHPDYLIEVEAIAVI